MSFETITTAREGDVLTITLNRPDRLNACPPDMADEIFAAIRDLNANHGITVFLVEQNAHHALRLAQRGYVMGNGEIALTGTGEELLADADVRAAYLEGGR